MHCGRSVPAGMADTTANTLASLAKYSQCRWASAAGPPAVDPPAAPVRSLGPDAPSPGPDPSPPPKPPVADEPAPTRVACCVLVVELQATRAVAASSTVASASTRRTVITPAAA